MDILINMAYGKEVIDSYEGAILNLMCLAICTLGFVLKTRIG